MIGLALHLPMAVQYHVNRHSDKTSTFATFTDLFIHSQFTKAWGILNGLQADMGHLFPQIMCRLSDCVSCLLDKFSSTKKLNCVTIMVKHLKSITATIPK